MTEEHAPVPMMRLRLTGKPVAQGLPLHGTQLALTDMDTGTLLPFKDLRLIVDDVRSIVWATFTVPLTEVDIEGLRGVQVASANSGVYVRGPE